MQPPPYFAYGSNLLLSRLQARAPSARPLGRARLCGYVWCCDKRGADGTAKANLAAVPGGETWGALFALAESEWPALDRAEGGYERVRVHALDDGGQAVEAWTYVSSRLAPELRPAAWYLETILAGARECDLPERWIERIASWTTAVRVSGRGRAPGTGR